MNLFRRRDRRHSRPAPVSATEGRVSPKYESILSLSIKKRFRFLFHGPVFARFVVSCLAAISITLMGVGVDMAIRESHKLIKAAKTAIVEDNPGQPLRWLLPALFQLLITSVFTALSVVIGYFAPDACGSGVPELESTMGGLIQREFFSLRVVLARLFGVFFNFLASQQIGKEGVTIGWGAALAFQIMQLPFWPGHRVEPASQEGLDILAAAAAAGVTATFNTPIASVIFAFEVCTSTLSPGILQRSFFTALLSTVTIQLLGATQLVTLFSSGSYAGIEPDWMSLLLSVLLGLLFGVLAGLWVQLHTALSRLILLQRPVVARFVFPLVSVLLVTVLVSAIPLFGQSQVNNLSFLLTNHSFAEIAQPGKLECGELFDFARQSNVYVFLFVCWLAEYLLTAFCTIQRFPAGLFTPVFLSGAFLGRLVGELCASWTGVPPSVFAMIGAGAMVGATTQTFSTAIIVLELSSAVRLMQLTTTAIITAILVARIFAPSVYKAMLRTKALPLMLADAGDLYANAPVEEFFPSGASSPQRRSGRATARSPSTLPSDVTVVQLAPTDPLVADPRRSGEAQRRIALSAESSVTALTGAAFTRYREQLVAHLQGADYSTTTRDYVSALPHAFDLAEPIVAVPVTAAPQLYDHALTISGQIVFPVVDSLESRRLVGEISREALNQILRPLRVFPTRRRRAMSSIAIMRRETRLRVSERLRVRGAEPAGVPATVLAAVPGEAAGSAQAPQDEVAGNALISDFTYSASEVDLRQAHTAHGEPELDTAPFTIEPDTRFSRLLLFARALPLLHAYVIDDSHVLIGVVRRERVVAAAVRHKSLQQQQKRRESQKEQPSDEAHSDQ